LSCLHPPSRSRCCVLSSCKYQSLRLHFGAVAFPFPRQHLVEQRQQQARADNRERRAAHARQRSCRSPGDLSTPCREPAGSSHRLDFLWGQLCCSCISPCRVLQGMISVDDLISLPSLILEHAMLFTLESNQYHHLIVQRLRTHVLPRSPQSPICHENSTATPVTCTCTTVRRYGTLPEQPAVPPTPRHGTPRASSSPAAAQRTTPEMHPESSRAAMCERLSA
jgi:hypothetical protein